MNALNETSEILPITGAGLSAESCISAYHDADGPWQNLILSKSAMPKVGVNTTVKCTLAIGFSG